MRKAVRKQLEITEEGDENSVETVDLEAQKDRIRQIITYQKSLYSSSSLSSSSVSSSASSRSSSSSSKSSSLLELMKGGGMSLRRLFDMEHTTLATHLKVYSGSPITKPIYLWGSDSDDGSRDLTSWEAMKAFRSAGDGCRLDSFSGFTLASSFTEGEVDSVKKRLRSRRRLTRKRSFKTLPGFRIWWNCNGIRFRLRPRRLKLLICGNIF